MRLGLWIVGALASVGSADVVVQVVPTGVTTMRLGTNTQPNGACTDAQGLGSCCANSSTTRGTNSTTEALLNTGRQVGSLISAGFTSTTGVDTFFRLKSTGLIVSPTCCGRTFYREQRSGRFVVVGSHHTHEQWRRHYGAQRIHYAMARRWAPGQVGAKRSKLTQRSLNRLAEMIPRLPIPLRQAGEVHPPPYRQRTECQPCHPRRRVCEHKRPCAGPRLVRPRDQRAPDH